MKVSSAITTALFASAVLAAPLTEKRRARHEARRRALAEKRSTSRNTNPPYKPGTTEILKLNSSDTTQVEYSSNWAGAVLIGTGYTAVTAELTVPTPSIPSGGNDYTEYCASAWVGIDGDTCDTAILQTGVDFCVEGSETYYDAWYEWYPDYAYDFTGITISAGDVVKVTVNATSESSGTATIVDETTDTTVSHTFSGETDELCEYNAEWIVEDFYQNDSEVPFADFGTVTFSSATATQSGTTVGPEDATIIDIEQNNEVLTSVSVTDDEVIVTYIG
ncbi:putative aspergillopepsin-2 heavy chain [Phaeomoniella chlamydospora]|uniref:Putative aspergillopepsin-2 heavy chain n=1 Tax=Phaeomoniella chlamydospora TaxID=158046 RepID=A0A0G2G1G2_PHACM|nr:putative aspergillopepsin-2 heavy chain [Phaeomoniella chlamydospora]